MRRAIAYGRTATKTPVKRRPAAHAPATRRRLQQCFEHGSKSSSGGNYDYATEMFTMCVQGDPGNLIYVQNFLTNLQKKYSNNKRGSKLAGLKGTTIKGSITKAGMQKDWKVVITSGLEMLKLNPWDLPTLKAIANACEQLQLDEVQLAYLKLALDVDIADPEINRLNARALGRLGRFDQAIVCWSRVQKALPRDEEAARAIPNLTVEKTIHRGGYEDAESSTEVMADKDAQSDRQGTSGPKLTPEQQLEKAIAKNPEKVDNYSELADLHLRHDRLEQAEQVLAKGCKYQGVKSRFASGWKISRCGGDAATWRSPKRRPSRKDARGDRAVEANERGDEPHRAGSLSQPLGPLSGQCQLEIRAGVRLQRAKNYAEAIKVYQQSMADTKRKAAIHLGLGECFQGIKQFKLAASNFEQAVASTSDREPEQKKIALYRAGKLSLFMKNLEVAEKYLTELAGLDFGYKDVGDLLDKLNQLREDGGSSG